VTLSDGVTAPSEVELLEPDRPDAVLVLSLGEGRKRQVKRMCNAIGHPVERLERIAFAGITAEGLEAGAWRYLTATEIALLRERVGL
jgi:23S rRNA pseudouridine2605 synthase